MLYEILHQYYDLLEEVKLLTDTELLEIISMLLDEVDFMKSMEKILLRYYKAGTISRKDRKSLENAYILYRSDYYLKE